MWLRLAIASLAACLLSSATMDGPPSSLHPQRPVRVATGPMLRPFPAQAQPDAPPTIAHRYAKLVARHSGLSFVEQPHDSTLAAIAAVCARQADLVLVQGRPRTCLCPAPASFNPARFSVAIPHWKARWALPCPMTPAD